MNPVAAPPPQLIAGFLDRIARRSSIRRTLLAVLALALAPLVVFSFVQGALQLAKERALSKVDLVASAQRVANMERTIFDQIHDGLVLLGTNTDDVAGRSDNCRSVLAVAAGVLPNVSSITSVTAAGRVACSSVARGTTDGAGISLSAPWQEDNMSGKLIARFDLAAYRRAFVRRHVTRSRTIAIVAQDGSIVAESRKLPWRRFAALGGIGIVDTLPGDGKQWLVTQYPMQLADADAPRLTLVAVQRDYGIFGPNPGVVISLFVIPLLAILMAMIALWMAANWVLLRWIDRLRDAAARIGGGQHRHNVGQFNDAPDEIRSLASSMQIMARAMTQRSAGLKTALAQQRLMSLELHHRVKNNLQIVGSYLAVRASQVDDADHLAKAQLRVAALSLVHRLLYDEGEIISIEVPILLTELARLLSSNRIAGGKSEVVVAIAEAAGKARMDIDTASTTSLFLVEIVDRLDDAESVMITVDGNDQRLVLTVLWSSGCEPHEVASSGLVAGFARQLGSTISLGSTPSAVTITFDASRAFRPAVAAA